MDEQNQLTYKQALRKLTELFLSQKNPDPNSAEGMFQTRAVQGLQYLPADQVVELEKTTALSTEEKLRACHDFKDYKKLGDELPPLPPPALTNEKFINATIASVEKEVESLTEPERVAYVNAIYQLSNHIHQKKPLLEGLHYSQGIRMISPKTLVKALDEYSVSTVADAAFTLSALYHLVEYEKEQKKLRSSERTIAASMVVPVATVATGKITHHHTTEYAGWGLGVVAAWCFLAQHARRKTVKDFCNTYKEHVEQKIAFPTTPKLVERCISNIKSLASNRR